MLTNNLIWQYLKHTLDKYQIYNEIYGPDTPITEIVNKALVQKEFNKLENIHLIVTEIKPIKEKECVIVKFE